MTHQVKTDIRLGIRLGFPSDQSPRCQHEETVGSYLRIAKCRGVSPRSFSAKFLLELSQSFSFAEKSLVETSDFYFSPRNKLFRARGVPRRNAKTELFFLGLICTYIHYITAINTDVSYQSRVLH